jgi:hypothetical protein
MPFFGAAWLDVPAVGLAVWAMAAGEASVKMQAEAKMIFFIKGLPGFRFV